MSAVLPGILEREWEAIERKLHLVASFADTIHIDLLDGVFAQNTSFLEPEPFKAYAETFTFELHMMVDNPLQYVKPFAEAGFRRFIGHVEKMPDQAEFVAVCEQYGEVGLALDASTSLQEVNVSFEDLDSLLIMTVKAGFSGQAFLPEALKKVSSLAAKYPFLTIEVDGGVNTETLTAAYQAGARRFVVTSALFGNNPPEAFTHLSETFARAEEATVLPE